MRIQCVGYIYNILLPYAVNTSKDLKLPQSFPILTIFDHFKGQLKEYVQNLLESNNILVVDVSSNSTDCLQPLDVSVLCMYVLLLHVQCNV